MPLTQEQVRFIQRMFFNQEQVIIGSWKRVGNTFETRIANPGNNPTSKVAIEPKQTEQKIYVYYWSQLMQNPSIVASIAANGLIQIESPIKEKYNENKLLFMEEFVLSLLQALTANQNLQ